MIYNTEPIEKFMEENSMNKIAFCKHCKIDGATYAKIFRGDTNMQLRTLRKIACAINVKASALLNEDSDADA